jgi:adenylate cyclase
MSSASAAGNGTTGPVRWSLRLFGGFELEALPSGERLTSIGKRERILLAYLALSPDHRQHRRRLATLLWGDSTDETALDNLRTCIWSLRRALGDTKHSLIVSEGERIVLNAAAFHVDVLDFRRSALQSGLNELDSAAKLYSGELLDGLSIEGEEFESWRRAEATRYRNQVMDVLNRLMTQLSEQGEVERATQVGTRILQLEPLHEPAVRHLMRMYSESGRRGAAMQLYRTLADGLRTELQAQPEAATRLVFAEISRTGEEQPDAPVVPATQREPRAVAVLPFVNMSGDASQEEPHVGRRLAAIFAADVAGYSRLMGQDEAGTVRALSAARARLGSLIDAHGGRLVNTVGDSALAEFPSAVDAVKCAMAAQEKRVQADGAPAEVPRLSFRIAVHVSDVLPSGTDIYGDGVNVCARLQEIAEPGGICVSGAAYQYVRKVIPVPFDDLGERMLKNIDEPVRVFAIRAADGMGHSPPHPKHTAAPFAAGEIAIAVLPFINMSGDASQDFFSDGMTEEITSALAKVPNLQVIARTSAFQFKGKNQDVRAVGQTLGVSHLIEGSVRRADERVRITAQLVCAGDGRHLWSESYDRRLTDIFAIQEDIAHAIAAALRAPLGLEPGGRLVPNRTRDLESYQQYLVARGLYRARGAGVAQAIATLEPLVDRDPAYAPAWALLARSHALAPIYDPILYSGLIEDARRLWRSSLNKMETAGRCAIQLDPKLADGLGALACIQTLKGKWIEADDLFAQALDLDPNDPETLHNYSVLLALVGKSRRALDLRERLRSMEPLVTVYNIYTALLLWATGQRAVAIAMVEQMPVAAFGGFYRNVILAEAYAAVGRFAEAADTLLLISGNQVSRRSVEDAARLIRTAPSKTKTPGALPKLEGELGFVYAHVGAIERVMEFPERNLEIGWVGSNANFPLWTPEHSVLRKTKRFKAYVRSAGMLDYWRVRGWPDLWGPSDADDVASNG